LLLLMEFDIQAETNRPHRHIFWV